MCPDGSTNAAEFRCATGEVCADGACEPQCEEGTTECVGGSVQRVCVAGGREWVNVPCQNGEVCEDGACGLEGGLECVPGAKDCEDGMARTCREDGSGWEEEECPGATECAEGECVGTVCTVGATKCDETVDNYLSNMRSTLVSGEGDFLEVPYNDQVIYRCVDGERWVAEPCASDEEVTTTCVYQGVDAADAARYREEGVDWFQEVVELFIFGDPTPGEVAAVEFPSAPEIPTQSAACVPAACTGHQEFDGHAGFFFESPTQARWCGEDQYEVGASDHTMVSQCEGLPPFSAPTITSTQCSGLTACGPGDPERNSLWTSEASRGCQVVDCLPDESVCDDGEGSGAYVECIFNEEYPGESYFDFGEGAYCPEKEDVCSDNGEVPQREIACDGVLLSDIPPPVLVEAE